MMMMMMMMMMYTYGGLVGAEERSYIDDHLVLIWIHQQQGGAIDASLMVMCTIDSIVSTVLHSVDAQSAVCTYVILFQNSMSICAAYLMSRIRS